MNLDEAKHAGVGPAILLVLGGHDLTGAPYEDAMHRLADAYAASVHVAVAGFDPDPEAETSRQRLLTLFRSKRFRVCEGWGTLVPDARLDPSTYRRANERLRAASEHALSSALLIDRGAPGPADENHLFNDLATEGHSTAHLAGPVGSTAYAALDALAFTNAPTQADADCLFSR